jgi:hypothetical protein
VDSDESTDDKEYIIISDQDGDSDSNGTSVSTGDRINYAGRREVFTGPQGVIEDVDIS